MQRRSTFETLCGSGILWWFSGKTQYFHCSEAQVRSLAGEAIKSTSHTVWIKNKTLSNWVSHELHKYVYLKGVGSTGRWQITVLLPIRQKQALQTVKIYLQVTGNNLDSVVFIRIIQMYFKLLKMSPSILFIIRTVK